mmetsp:Transcript_6318/g.13948  ORF Transcript_6318/g.13948 Transcript_6318/m.13948 type:complete len:474 (-) Transcript_6318:86-1507(-)
MIGLCSLFVVVALIGQVSAFNVGRQAPAVLQTRLLMEPLSHSATFNLMRNAVAERDDSFTIAELTEIQEYIAASLKRKETAKSASNSLSELCQITKEACDAVTPMLQAIYAKISEPENVKGTAYFEDRTAKLKADATFFSIADGIVQHMFIDFLFAGNKFGAIVGEEDDTVVNLVTRPYTVDDLTVPEEFNSLVERTLEKVKALSGRIDSEAYKQLTVFCDPIDGTREFATGKGECVSILIGYNDPFGKPVAGIMYRPLTLPVTWAAGAASENCVMGHLDMADYPNPRGLLVTDGKISDFISRLIVEMGYQKVNSLASGNRALMLLEGKAGAYIRDTGGFAKWDTSGPAAVIDAYGGTMSKLPNFLENKSLESYTHLKTEKNLDFEEGAVTLTLSNAKDKSIIQKPETVVVRDGMTTTTTVVTSTMIAADTSMVKEYSCLAGLVCVDRLNIKNLDSIHAAMMKVKANTPPTYT